MKKTLFTAVLVFATAFASAQYDYRDSNHIGINVGVNQFSLNSSDIDATAEIGWNAGLSVRCNFYNDFDMVYGIQFSENVFSVPTTGLLNTSEVKYKLDSAQISLLLSYKFIENHLSVEFGPMLQVNGKLTGLDEEDENNIVNGTTITAKEFTKVSTFNFYPTIGITGGVKHVRANISYQYGVNNILGNIDTGGEKLKANAGILAANIIFYL